MFSDGLSDTNAGRLPPIESSSVTWLYCQTYIGITRISVELEEHMVEE